MSFCCLVGFQSDWSFEGAVGPSERHGGHAAVSPGGYKEYIIFVFKEYKPQNLVI